MKRSAQIGLSAAGFLAVASAAPLLRHEEAVVYDDVAACQAAAELSEAQCERRFEEARSAHIEGAKRFGSVPDCEAEYGPGRCEELIWNGAQVIVPALAGFAIARSAIRDGNAVARPLLPPDRQTCPPDDRREECRRKGGVTAGGSGGGGSSRRSSGSRAYTTLAGEAVNAMNGRTRASVVSRGGFGSTGHFFGSSSS